MTLPVLVVKVHNRRWVRSIGPYGCPDYFVKVHNRGLHTIPRIASQHPLHPAPTGVINHALSGGQVSTINRGPTGILPGGQVIPAFPSSSPRTEGRKRTLQQPWYHYAPPPKCTRRSRPIGIRRPGVRGVGGGCAAKTSSSEIEPWHIGQSLTPECQRFNAASLRRPPTQVFATTQEPPCSSTTWVRRAPAPRRCSLRRCERSSAHPR